MTIPGGSAAQPLDAPYPFPVSNIYMDFENGIYTLDGTPVDPDTLIDGLVPGNFTDEGLVKVSQLTAKGALFKSLANALASGALIFVEFEVRYGTGYITGQILSWFLDTYSGDIGGANQIRLDADATNGVTFDDLSSVYARSGAEVFPTYWGYAQRVGISLCMKTESSPFFSGNRYWGVAGNNIIGGSDESSYLFDPVRVKRIDVFGTESWGAYTENDWIIRKLEVRPQTYLYEEAMLYPYALQTMTARDYYAQPVTSKVGKDHGGKTSYRFGPATLANAADANRLVIAALVAEKVGGSGPASATAVTLGGIAAECVASNDEIEVWQALVPTGTTVELAVTYADDMAYCAAYITDLVTTETVPYDARAGYDASGANVVLSNVPSRNGGVVLGIMKADAADSGASWTWSGSGTPATADFNMNGLHAVSFFGVTPSADATGLSLTCDAPAGATTDVFAMALSYATAAVSNDPHWTSVKLLLGFNGADAATTFTAEESSPHALTFAGNAQLDTAQQKFGSASLLCDGTGDYVTTPDNADWDISNGAFTVEAHVRFTGTGNQTIIGQWIATAGNRAWLFDRSNLGNLQFTVSTTGSNSVSVMSVSGGFSTGVWYHVRVSFDGTTYRMYVDGIQIASSTSVSTAYNAGSVLSVGGQGTGTNSLNGWLDEVRFTKGVARNPGLTKFKPPQSAYPRA